MSAPNAAKKTDSDAGMWVEDEMKIQNHKDTMPRSHEQKSEHSGPVSDVDPGDPMNWPLWLKIVILIQTSILAALGGLNTAAINPAYGLLARDFGINKVRASYQTTVCIALNGAAPWLWIPLSNKYGRRPVYLATTFLGFASALGCAYTQTFAQLIVARVFNGLFPVAFALGASTITDLFYYEQRGRAMGFFTVLMTTGSHIAPIVGGLLGQYCGWRWIFKFVAIVDAFMLVVAFFCLPETLYIRQAAQSPSNPSATGPTSEKAPKPKFNKAIYFSSLRLYSHFPQLKLRPNQFVLPALKMAKYPSVTFPALYYGTIYGFASILPAVTVASIFTEFFHWNTLTIGLAYGGSLTIGSILGECVSGWVVDTIVIRERRRLGRDPEPEIRLRAIWAGEVIVPTGLLIYGFCLQYHTAWIAPILGMGIACFGLQIITTTTYTYATDCYRTESGEVAQLFNFIRQEIGMTFAFYAVNLANHIGYQWTFLMFALIGGGLAFVPMLLIIIYGESWRKELGKPVGVNAFDSMLEAGDERNQAQKWVRNSV
ncbi:MFS general substrate transporter [Exophiala viscosa]|uniref:MFS general substrate transporter n=1 Tax=Exophiala viscosa TaxID=2486360 RepID=A0AAN6E4R3_9EURO|nr:MFS general substrate transporter [Exophiala viscosa]KAI1629350.1 MFS general substrate transporter [Exophiala viscosa]